MISIPISPPQSQSKHSREWQLGIAKKEKKKWESGRGIYTQQAAPGCTGDQATALLCLPNPPVRRRRREVVTTHNNNKAHSGELPPTRASEASATKHMPRDVRWASDSAPAILGLSLCSATGNVL